MTATALPKRLARLVAKSYRVARQEGTRTFAQRCWRHLKTRWRMAHPIAPARAPLPLSADRAGALPRVAFLVPHLDISGGIAVVLQHAHRLQQLGHEVTVLTLDDQRQCPWFPYQSFRILPLGRAREEAFDVLVATFWTTVRQTLCLPARRRFYFIQSDESRFYPNDPRRQQAVLETYRAEVELIVVARWLEAWLAEGFGREAHYVPNGVDPALFHPAAPIAPPGARPRVLLEGAIDLPFKGMANAFRAVEDLECDVWCVSSIGRPKSHWRCDRFFGKVPQQAMKHIYSSCDVLLKMSEVEAFFLPPLEMMACGAGACVLGEVTGMDEYVEDGVNALVVAQGDVDGARRAVKRLIDDAALRRRLIAGGLETARRFDWNRLSARLQQILCSPAVSAAGISRQR